MRTSKLPECHKKCGLPHIAPADSIVHTMQSTSVRFLALVLAQVAQTGLIDWLVSDSPTGFPRALFFYGIPLVLAGATVARQRWAFMGGVVYATVGLALDIATMVFGVTHEQPVVHLALGYGVSAAINFAIIVVGGHGFLAVTPPGAHRPNPPSQVST